MSTPEPLADVAALADWLGQTITSTTDTKRAGMVLRAASALVRHEAGKTWLNTDGTLVDEVPEQAILVTLACAGRGYVNPKGIIDTSETVDDYTIREQVKPEESGLYLTRSERDLLASLNTTRVGGLSTVPTERGDLLPTLCDEDERLLPPWY